MPSGPAVTEFCTPAAPLMLPEGKRTRTLHVAPASVDALIAPQREFVIVTNKLPERPATDCESVVGGCSAHEFGTTRVSPDATGPHREASESPMFRATVQLGERIGTTRARAQGMRPQ